jgi:hypothetical protein
LKSLINLFTFALFFLSANLGAQTTLNCIVELTSLESRVIPLFGFEGTKTFNVNVTVLQDNRIQISGLGQIDAVYPPTKISDSGINFSGLLKFPNPNTRSYYGDKIISGSLNRFNGSFDIYTPADNLGFITFSGKGFCSKASRLF